MVRILLLVALSLTLAACGSSDDNTETAADTPVSAPGPAPSADPGPKVYVFGDSLSDTGNLIRPAIFHDGLPPPFFENRISNGPVIVDYIARRQGRVVDAANYLSLSEEGSNYAVAGAKAYDGGLALDLGAQVSSFRAKNGDVASAQAIYIIFIGGNDVIRAVDAGDNAQAGLDLALAEIRQAINELTAMGARRLFVLNVPDIGKTPRFISDSEAGAAERLALASSLTASFNDQLTQALPSLNSADVTVTGIDVYGLFNEVLARADQESLVNVTEACYLTAEFRFSEICSAELISGFAFFDDLHPTAAVHRLIGEQIATQIATQIEAGL